MRTQVAIIGAGPAGLMLGRLLELAGLDAVVIEQRSPEYVLGRIRAGVLEQGSVELMERVALADRLHRDGLRHHGIELAFDGETHRLDFNELVGRHVTIYGQTEVTQDLMSSRQQSGSKTVYEAEGVAIADFDTDRPRVRYRKDGQGHVVTCDFIAGCDGFRGVSRASAPEQSMHVFERRYPFGWLGVLVDQPPVAEELIYAHHERGFALCSMRSATRSRYYVQVTADQKVDQWSDDRFWDELRSRLDPATAERLKTGRSIEKSIAPLRSFVVEPLRFGTLFLAGDAAHIVPPTGTKGLNLALSDVQALAEVFVGALSRTLSDRVGPVFRPRSEAYLDGRALLLVDDIPSPRFSRERRFQRAEFDYLMGSRSAQVSLAESYTGILN